MQVIPLDDWQKIFAFSPKALSAKQLVQVLMSIYWKLRSATLVVFAVLIFQGSIAGAVSVADLRARYANEWVIISRAEPLDNRGHLLALNAVDEGQMDAFLTYLGRGGMPFREATRVHEGQALERMQGDRDGRYSLIIRGQQLQSQMLQPLLLEPFRVFVLQDKPGSYPIALRWQGQILAGESGAWAHAQGTGPLRSGHIIDLEALSEPLMISEGDNVFYGDTVDHLFLDGSVPQQHAVDLLKSAGYSFAQIHDFTTPDAITNTGRLRALLVQATSLRSEGILTWMKQRARDVTIRRFGTIPVPNEITMDLRQLSAIDVGGVDLDLTPVPKAVPTTPPPQAPATRQDERSLPLLSGNDCHFFPYQDGKTSDRLAFVVGNGSYDPRVGWLENPVSDASAVADMLNGLGFDIYVTIEATKNAMQSCLFQATRAAELTDIAVFYYSGHGIQIADRNYVVPIDVKPGSLAQEALLPFEEITQPLRAISRSTLIFLDACRDNPLTEGEGSGLAALGTVPANDGIDPAQNEYAVLFATSPNAVASDGRGANSPFTTALLGELPKQGAPVQEALVKISAAVGAATQWQQTPFTRSSLRRILYLNGNQTPEGIKAASRVKAEDALIQVVNGDWAKGRRLALEALPKDVTPQEALTDFKEVARVLELVRFVPHVDLKAEIDAIVFGVVGRNWELALITPKKTGAYETAQIFDVATGLPVAQVPYVSDSFAYEASNFADSRGGRFAAVSADDGRIILVDVQQGQMRIIPLQAPGSERNYSLDIEHMEFSPSGARLLAMTDAEGVMIFDTATGALVDHVKGLTLGKEQITFGPIRTEGHFRFVSDDVLCFAATRLQSPTYPKPDMWDFLAVGKYTIPTRQISDLLWTTTRWDMLGFDCPQGGRYALIGGEFLPTDKTYSDMEHPTWGLLDFSARGYVMSEQIDSYGFAHLSPDGQRVMLLGDNTLKLYDIAQNRFLNIPRSFGPQEAYAGEVLTSINGDGNIDASFTVSHWPADSFKLDISLDQMLADILAELPPTERREIEASRPRLRFFD